MKKNPLFFPSLIILFGLLLFTILVRLNFLNKFDLAVTESLQRIIPRYLDTPFSVFSLVGSFEFVLLILFILWAKRKEMSYFYVLIFFSLFHLAEFLGKFFINHPNPPFKFFRYDIPFSMPSSGINTGSSFPSGHMGRTMFVSIIFAFIIYKAKKLSTFQKKLLYCFVAFVVILMFVSRIYLGEHWFSDVAGGVILGAFWGILSLRYL